MLRFPLVAVLFVAASLSLALAPAAAHADQDLSRSYDVTLGHVFATSLERDIATMALITDWDAPITVDYAPEADRLEIEILGARSEATNAKNSLDRFRRELLTISLARANERHGTDVTKDQLQIVYRNRQQWEAVIRYRDGRYEVPK